MNDEPTQNLSETRSFEERVFMRFDTVDSRLERLESRSHDTKPIWERALTEIHETRIELGEVKAGLAGVKTDVAGLKADVTGLKTDVTGLKTDVTGLKTDVAGLKTDVAGLKTDVAGLKTDMARMKNEFSDAKREVRRQVTKRLDQIQVYQLEYREDIRDAYERIEKLETKVGLEPDHS
jgi:chromosome segregation ATPase